MISSRYSSEACRDSSLAIISCRFRAIILATSFRSNCGRIGSSDSTKKVLSCSETVEYAMLGEWKGGESDEFGFRRMVGFLKASVGEEWRPKSP